MTPRFKSNELLNCSMPEMSPSIPTANFVLPEVISADGARYHFFFRSTSPMRGCQGEISPSSSDYTSTLKPSFSEAHLINRENLP